MMELAKIISPELKDLSIAPATPQLIKASTLNTVSFFAADKADS